MIMLFCLIIKLFYPVFYTLGDLDFEASAAKFIFEKCQAVKSDSLRKLETKAIRTAGF